jgi:hypothetical protein
MINVIWNITVIVRKRKNQRGSLPRFLGKQQKTNKTCKQEKGHGARVKLDFSGTKMTRQVNKL